jgi:hypothetical protein
MTIEKSSVRRSEVTQVRVRRVHLEQAVITREVAIVRQAEMRVRIATDQKRVVLSEGKDAAFVRAGCDFQIDLHYGLACSEVMNLSSAFRVQAALREKVVFSVKPLSSLCLGGCFC